MSSRQPDKKLVGAVALLLSLVIVRLRDPETAGEAVMLHSVRAVSAWLDGIFSGELPLLYDELLTELEKVCTLVEKENERRGDG